MRLAFLVWHFIVPPGMQATYEDIVAAIKLSLGCRCQACAERFNAADLEYGLWVLHSHGLVALRFDVSCPQNP